MSVVRERLARIVAERRAIPAHMVWASADSVKEFQSLLRRTLFLGLSDGARMDALRRTNTGIISNEQVMIATELEDAKWKSAVKKLRAESGDAAAKFEVVFLIDDFAGSGKTCLRKEPDGSWDGKLAKFYKRTTSLADTFVADPVFCVHHYVASHEASMGMPTANDAARKDRGTDWFRALEFTFGAILPTSVKVTRERHGQFLDLVEKYYDSAIETVHTDVGGSSGVRLGFGACALPLVLEHNTPNNSVALLWADTEGEGGQHPMRPLFRRRQRHI